jgi:exopolysaccharide production protein ExoZ
VKPLRSIQYLRAFAVLAVVGYHASQWRGGGFDLGRAGVDVFFVISGVIMWRVTSAPESSPRVFLWHRLTRVAPLYWLITLALAAVAAAWPAFLPNVHPAWGHLALSLGFIPHLDPKGLPFPLLPPGWSLNYEALFYCVFAGALLAPRSHQTVAVTGALTAIVLFGALVYQPAYFLGANPMLLQFAAGVALADLGDRVRLPGRIWGVSLVGTGLAGFVLPAMIGGFNELWRPLIWGLPAFLIVAGALCVEAADSVPDWRGLDLIGDASFSIYLTHLPATAVVAHTLGRANAWLFYPAAIGVSIATGVACYFWLERPLIRLARHGPSALFGRPAAAA